MIRRAGSIVCAGAVVAGLALVGASFHGIAGLDRELELAASREQPRPQLVVQEVEVRDHACPWAPDRRT